MVSGATPSASAMAFSAARQRRRSATDAASGLSPAATLMCFSVNPRSITRAFTWLAVQSAVAIATIHIDSWFRLWNSYRQNRSTSRGFYR